MEFVLEKMEKMIKVDVLLEFQHSLLIREGKNHVEALKHLYKNEILEDRLRAKTYITI